MTIEEIKAFACDEICKWPSEYKDPDDMWSEQCDHCRLRELLEEETDG